MRAIFHVWRFIAAQGRRAIVLPARTREAPPQRSLPGQRPEHPTATTHLRVVGESVEWRGVLHDATEVAATDT